MSGAYFVQTGNEEDLHPFAHLLSAQMVHGQESVNHFATARDAVFGLVSPDNFKQGIMPRFLATQGLWGILQGEIYDSEFMEVWRQAHPAVGSDLEVFAEMYRGGSLRLALPHLNGAFFVILYDPESDTLVAANDRFGLYPMYWARRGVKYCLASRVLSSVLSGVVEGEWDPTGVSQLLTLDDYLGETTLLKDVAAFPQATLLVKQGATHHMETYWRYDYTPRENGGRMEDLGQEVGEHFVRAVSRQCARRTRVGITLSGGLDSRCLLAATAQLGIPVNTYTWGQSRCYDRLFAQDAARHFGATHHDVEYQHQQYPLRFAEGMRVTEGLVNVFDFHMLAHLHVMEGKSDVILNGFAGDLVLGGSFLRPQWLKPVETAQLTDLLFAWRNTLLQESRLAEAMPDSAAPSDNRMPSAIFRRVLAATDGPSTPDIVDRFFLENRERRMIAMGTVMMRSAVESAAGFFDYDLIDLTTSIPADRRYEHKVYRAMMARILPDTLKIRWQRTLLPAGAPDWTVLPAKAFLKGCRIVEGVLGWPRIGSRQSPVDFASWLRGPLRPWMESICLEPHPDADSVLRSDFCAQVWKEHLAGRNQYRLLGAIAALRGFSTVLGEAQAGRPASTTKPTQVLGPG